MQFFQGRGCENITVMYKQSLFEKRPRLWYTGQSMVHYTLGDLMTGVLCTLTIKGLKLMNHIYNQ